MREWSCLGTASRTQEAFLSHANAALTPRARLRLAKLIVEERWPVIVAAKMFMTSPPTARKWAARFRAEGPAGMVDRSSRPRSMPTKTPPATVKRILRLRWRRRLGPAQIAGELGISASEVVVVARPHYEGGRIVLRPPVAKDAGETQFEFRILKGHTAEQLLKHRSASVLVFVGFACMGLATIVAGEEMIRDSVEVVEVL